MAETRVQGFVRAVQFNPSRRWFLMVQVDHLWDNERKGWYQIDAADIVVNGREVDEDELLSWFVARRGSKKPMPGVVLTGIFGQGTYETCDRAEFADGPAEPEE
jgi:hypothetical protein